VIQKGKIVRKPIGINLMIDDFFKKFETHLDGPGINNRLHWTTVVSEKLVLAIIGALTVCAVGLELVQMWERKNITLPDLFLLFIFAEIIGMVGAFLCKQAHSCDAANYHRDHSFVQVVDSTREGNGSFDFGRSIRRHTDTRCRSLFDEYER
tara:strand:+ start:1241 stop:1696 length:456 start_codon:yes stop_codon:yes gene_type:complete